MSQRQARPQRRAPVARVDVLRYCGGRSRNVRLRRPKGSFDPETRLDRRGTPCRAGARHPVLGLLRVLPWLSGRLTREEIMRLIEAYLLTRRAMGQYNSAGSVSLAATTESPALYYALTSW